MTVALDKGCPVGAFPTVSVNPFVPKKCCDYVSCGDCGAAVGPAGFCGKCGRQTDPVLSQWQFNCKITVATVCPAPSIPVFSRNALSQVQCDD